MRWRMLKTRLREEETINSNVYCAGRWGVVGDLTIPFYYILHMCVLLGSWGTYWTHSVQTIVKRPEITKNIFLRNVHMSGNRILPGLFTFIFILNYLSSFFSLWKLFFHIDSTLHREEIWAYNLGCIWKRKHHTNQLAFQYTGLYSLCKPQVSKPKKYEVQSKFNRTTGITPQG